MKVLTVTLEVELNKEDEEQFFIDGELNECEVYDQVKHMVSDGNYKVDIMEKEG